MQVLKGRQAVFYINVDDTWYPALCAVTCGFQFDVEEIERTTVSSGLFIERKGRLINWGFNLTGLTKVNNTDGQIAFQYFVQNAGNVVEARLKFTDDNANEINIYGDVLIKQGNIEATVGGFCMASLYFPGSGPYNTGTPGGIVAAGIYKLYLSTTPGAYEVSHADLGEVIEILRVVREDATCKQVLSSPTGKQFMYTDETSSGKITFDSTIPFAAGEIVYVLYEK